MTVNVGLACLFVGYTLGLAVTLIDDLLWPCIAWTFLATSVALHWLVR